MGAVSDLTVDLINRKWKVQSYGGTWGIVTFAGFIVADDIPHGALADHIVKLHNEDIDRALINPLQGDF